MGKYGYNHGEFGWNELAVDNPEAAVEFYKAIFNWDVEEMEMPDGIYNVLSIGEEKVGGIMKKPEAQSGGPSAWMPYITVENVDETATKMQELGGKVIQPPTDIPVENGPRLSVVQDPFGAVLGVITYANAPEPAEAS